MDRRTLANKISARRRVRRLALLALAAMLVAQSMLPALCAGASSYPAAGDRRRSALAIDPGAPDTYSAVLYDNTNGLPTSEANAIAQTSEGFLWIGCYGGLIRYDGNTFVRMDSSSGITSVRCLYVDSRDRLWVGTNDNGLFLMKDGSIRHWNEADGLQGLSIRDIHEDDTGLIYVASTGGLALIDQDLTLRLPEDARVTDTFLHELQRGKDGKIYGLTNDGDIFSMHAGEMLWFLERGNCRFKGVSGIMPDPEHPGYMYIESKNGLVHYGTPENGFSDAGSIDIRPLQFVQAFRFIDGKLWICAGNGVGYLDKQGFHTLQDIPMNGSVESVTMDYEGNLWFTSTRQGVMKLVPNRFSDLFQSSGLPEAVVNSTCMYGDKLFIGTDTGLRVLRDAAIVYHIPLASPQHIPRYNALPDETTNNLIKLLDGVRIRSIMRDSSDRLWISTWRSLGLLRYDHGDLKIFGPEDGLFSDRVRTVVERSDGSFLVACTGGVNVIEGDRVTASYGPEVGIGNTDILTVCEGPEGEIFVGTDSDGIYIIGRDGVRQINKESGLQSGVVMRIKRDRTRDIYWIVTGNSLAWMSPDGQVTTLEHFPYFNNFDLYENSRDEMWVLSGNGVYVLSVDDLLEDADLWPIYIGVANGLPSIPTSNGYSELTGDGILYIACASGVTTVDIEAPIDSVNALKLAVPFVDADGVRIYPDKAGNFTVGSQVRKLTVYPYVFNYSLINPEVRYCLYGFDRESVTLNRDELTPVDYTNLPGGTYTFSVQLDNPLGRGNNQTSVKITKERAFFENPWFYLLAALLTVAVLSTGVGAYVRRRIRILEEKHRAETERQRIGTELSMASQIQNSMLPHTAFPDRREFDICASMDPAREVGGDFYDYFLIDDDHLCMVMADVSGKGIPAALFMMVSKVILQSCAMLGRAPAEILTKTNEALSSNNQVDMFVTVWLGILEISTGKLTAANAGHEYPVLCLDKKFELLKDKHGFVIGGMENMKYREYEIALAPGDKLFLYTDGVPEATDAENQMFGTERMLAALNEAPAAAPEQILKNVRRAVDEFVRDAEQFDDLTMLCLEYRGQDGAGASE